MVYSLVMELSSRGWSRRVVEGSEKIKYLGYKHLEGIQIVSKCTLKFGYGTPEQILL